MSHRHVPVGWSPTKLTYDALLLAAVLAYLLIYQRLAPLLQPYILPPDDSTLALRAFGSCAFILLTLLLCIGPLARLDPRLLPLLYNRRHFGVILFTVALGHAWHVLGWYFAFSPIPPIEALLTADTAFAQLHGFPFIPFGIAALLILAAMAFTSHDFWLNFLTPPVWKRLHMGVYAAYTLAVAHICLGALQSSVNPLLGMVVAGSAALVATLHLAAAQRARTQDEPPAIDRSGWVDAGPAAAIAEGHGIVVPLDRGSVAIFRDNNTLSAISNLCAHQNGPLGEGRVLDGCVTCPWHGFQYRLTDGRAPPPFTERLATYRLRLQQGHILLDPTPNPPGTYVEPVQAE